MLDYILLNYLIIRQTISFSTSWTLRVSYPLQSVTSGSSGCNGQFCETGKQPTITLFFAGLNFRLYIRFREGVLHKMVIRSSHKPYYQLPTLFLGAFAIFRKATTTFFMSVRLSVSPHETTRPSLNGFL